MKCNECGSEVPIGAYFCDGCGRPVGFPGGGDPAEESAPGFESVPAPGPSRESPGPMVAALSEEGGGVESRPSARAPGRSLCSMCMGSFPETALTIVEGAAYCPDCSPLSGRRTIPEVDELRVESLASVPPPAGSMETGGYGPRMSPVFTEEKTAGAGLRVLFGVLLLVLAGGAAVAAWSFLGGDRIDRLIAGATDDGHSYLLVQKYTEGARHDYAVRLKMSLNGEGAMMGGTNTFEMDAKLAGRLGMDILSVDDRGNANMRVTLDGFNAECEARVGGQPVPTGTASRDLAQLNGVAIEYRVGPFGEPLTEPRLVAGHPTAGFTDLLTEQMKGVPQEELSAGDTWTSDEQIPLGEMQGMSGAGSMSLRATYELVGVKKYAGRNCIVIAIDGEMSAGSDQLPPQLAAIGDIDLDVQMKGVAFFDPEAGIMVKTAMDVDVEFSGASAGAGVEMAMKMALDMDLR